MRVDKAYPTTHQRFPLDHRQNLGMFTLLDGWQVAKPPQDTLPVPQTTTGDLAENHPVHYHFSRIQHVLEKRLCTAQVLDPH